MRFFKVFFINFLLLYFFLYSIEILINYQKKTFYQKNRTYYVNLLQKKNLDEKYYLNFLPYKLLNEKKELLLLSGYENANIILCLDEKNKPIIFRSDNNGFRNYNNENHYDILLIGDSFVQGYCVNDDNYLNNQFKKFKIKTKNLAVGANGPLLEFATYKEYEHEIKYKNLILFITPENDFYDLSLEKNNSILLRYLNDKSFRQNLLNKENREIKKNILNAYFKNNLNKDLSVFFNIYHFNLKEVGKLTKKILKKKKSFEETFYYLKNKEIDNLFFLILDNFYSSSLDQKEGKFFVVFNSFSPNLIYPKNKEEEELKKLLENKLTYIKYYLNKKSIKYFDFNEYVNKNYNKENIQKVFKNIDNNWDHYSEEGYYILAREINKTLIEK
jgi:hypothetical protein